MLAISGCEPDTWGLTDKDTINERLAYVAEVERVEIASAGHFPHMEQPAQTARVVLDFLAS